MKTNSIVLVAGHSGGHILPGMIVAQKYQQQLNAQLLFISTTKLLDATIAQNYQVSNYYAFSIVTSASFWAKIKQIWLLLVALIKSFAILGENKPSMVLSTGGLVSIPVCLAANCLNIPITLIELNVQPGKAVKFLASIAQEIMVVFPETLQFFPKATQLTYPHRFTQEHKAITRLQAQQQLLLPEIQFTLLVVGGSQGSFFINTLLQQFFSKHKEYAKKITVLHQSGYIHAQNLTAWYAEHNIKAHVFAFHNDMHLMYQAADLIICRAGSGTLHEIAYFQKKACVIPLVTKSTDHQTGNADSMHERYPELFWVFEQCALQSGPETLFNRVVLEYEKYTTNQTNAPVGQLTHQLQSL